MTDGNAAGRKTENPLPKTSGYANHIDELLGLMTCGVRTSLARADEIAPERDEYGHKRGAEVGNAAKLVNAGAQLAMALGRLNGTFHHNITVHRTQSDVKEPGGHKRRFLDGGSGPPIEIPTTSSHPPLDRALKRWHAEEDEIERLEEEDRREEERRKVRGGGTPREK